jgi:hypothetical protein
MKARKNINHKLQAQSFCDDLQKRLPKVDITKYIKPTILDKITEETGGATNQRSKGGVNEDDETNNDFVPESIRLKRQATTGQNENIFTNEELLFQ